MSDTLSSTLYLQYLSALTSAIDLPGDPQIISPYQVWNWGGNQGSIAGLTYDQYISLNQIPISPIVDSTTWGSVSGFGSVYNLWMTIALNPYVGKTDPELVELQNAVNSDQEALETANTTALTNYKNFVQSNSTAETETQWLQNEGSVYADAITTAQNQLAYDTAALNNYTASKTSAVQNAVQTYNTGLTNITNPLSNQSISVPGWATSQVAIDYVNSITGSNPGGPVVKGNPISFSTNQATDSYDYQSSWMTGETLTWVWDFFLGEGENSRSSVSTDSFSSNYSLTFSFGDLSTILVSPGQWYTAGLPALLGPNGPYQESYSGFESPSSNTTYFFGPPQGNLERMTTAMIVGYQPNVVISAGAAFATTLQNTWNSEGGLVIGPFVFGSGNGGSSTADTFSVNDGVVTLQSNALWPSIIAYVSNWVVPPPSAK